MNRIKKSTIITFLFLTSFVWSLNPIHESSYGLVSRDIYQQEFHFGTGVYYDPDGGTKLHVPLSFGWSPSGKIELGVGLKTRWLDSDSNFPWMVFGFKLKIRRGFSYHMDLLLSTSSGSETGLASTFYFRRSLGRRIFYRFVPKIGMMNGLTNDALFAMEFAIYPTIKLFSPVMFEFGFIGSSQTKRFEQHLAMDMQPAVIIGLGRESQIVTSLTIGLAGDRKEKIKIKAILVKSF